MGIVAGTEEARARATLVEMLSRISLGPHAALGVSASATPQDVRAAFLGLTKTFHPARFGRMSPDVQRLSTEVFLGIKGAHEALLKALGVPARTAAAGSGAVVRAPSPDRTSQRIPAVARPVTPPFGVRAVPPRPSSPPQPDAPKRPTGPIPVQPAPAPATEQVELQRALDLMAARNWGAARQAMTALAARSPASKPYRALLCYVRGREAQAAGRPADALLEMQRALQFDPELAQAKAAIAELQGRR
jgi:hypothetical protein